MYCGPWHLGRRHADPPSAASRLHDAIEAIRTLRGVGFTDGNWPVHTEDVREGRPIQEVGAALDSIRAAALAGNRKLERAAVQSRTGNRRGRRLDRIDDPAPVRDARAEILRAAARVDFV